jgi:hypothetical protein
VRPPFNISRRSFLRRTAPLALGTAALTSTIRDLRLISAAMAQNPVTDYKALICEQPHYPHHPRRIQQLRHDPQPGARHPEH